MFRCACQCEHYPVFPRYVMLVRLSHKFYLLWFCPLEEGPTLMRGAFFLSGHNAGHHGELRSLRDRGLGSVKCSWPWCPEETVRLTVVNHDKPYTVRHGYYRNFSTVKSCEFFLLSRAGKWPMASAAVHALTPHYVQKTKYKPFSHIAERRVFITYWLCILLDGN